MRANSKLAAPLAAAAALFTAAALLFAPAPAPPAGAAAHHVAYDRHSLTVDGRRVLLWSGEFHYFRLPSPVLWRDVLEKIKAAGFNGVSLYFDWAYHSPAPGKYDFTGVRDVDRLLRLTEKIGLYVVARPGPYINAETTGGGFPAWLKTVPGRARSSDPNYTRAYREWLARIDPIIARHQVTRGGSVIVYNAENEYAANTDPAYMEDLQRQARAHGIDVPISHNQCCDASWTPTWATGRGAVQIPGVDDYPQAFECRDPDTWGTWGEGVTERLSPDAPAYAAEYQAGAIDLNRAGYEKCRELTGPNYMKVYYKSNLITSGATMFGYYMAFGGTNWGRLAQPNDVYTSYDYGAPITENRRLTAKYDEFKRQGLFVTTVAPLAKTDPAAAPASGNSSVHTEARANPDTGTQFVLVRHADRKTDDDQSANLAWNTPDGTYDVPVTLKGRDAKILVAGYDMGGQRLAASTSELLTHTTANGRDMAVLYGTEGVEGTTVLRYNTRPDVKVLSGSVKPTYSNGNLRLDYTHQGLARVQITGGGRRPLLLLLGTEAEAAKFWRSGNTLVRGTDLVRSAETKNDTAVIRADVAETGDIEVFASARRITLNGERLHTRTTPSGTLLARTKGPRPITLPALKHWRGEEGAPESSPGFDDSSWKPADHTTTAGPIKPKKPPVLYADDYGFHYGHVWYRGHFTATGDETTVNLNAITGKGGIYQVWLNGRYLGSAAGGEQKDADAPINDDPGPGTFEIPAGALPKGEKAVLSVLVENMGHNDDWTADDYRQKQPRGLVNAEVTTNPITWRIQGTRISDPLRGPLNTGGLYGEREGWHLPSAPAKTWSATSPADLIGPGVHWYSTRTHLALPKDQDVPVTLHFEPGTGRYRTLIFINGWNMGEYVNGGVQHDFTLPEGVLRPRGHNTVTLAVIAEEDSKPGRVSLKAAANVRGGAPAP
ncbi:Beta-galactosidase, domain 3 [Actinomadura madurae]|uniref:beta-galactosidase n=2 Tax=Actinomadura madurae TaxID=1993 RepID=A0A1I4ZH06_9ACTN|nr:beta-galactosidase [Actinomadura madurae]SFN49437.1 Beta-galactosidase, domain 3 [Actinomadura madurae]